MTTKPQTTLAYLDAARDAGVTWKELSQAYVWGHSNASRVLSEAHRDGHVVRLAEKRNNCSVYVLPGWRRGRDTVPHKRDTVTAEGQALAGCLDDTAAMAARVVRLIESYGLCDSRFQTMRVLGSDLLTAVGRETTDEPGLPL